MRICAIGDSIMNGTGDPEALGWIGRLVQPRKRADRQITLYNLGIRGNTSADIRARWRDEATKRQAPGVETGLVFAFGVNDSVIDGQTGRPRVDPAETAENAAAILADARALGRVLMVGPGPIADADVNARIGALDDRLGPVAREAGVPYLPVYAALAQSPVWMAEVARWDGAHPGADGYGEMAKLVAGWDPWQAWFA